MASTPEELEALFAAEEAAEEALKAKKEAEKKKAAEAKASAVEEVEKPEEDVEVEGGAATPVDMGAVVEPAFEMSEGEKQAAEHLASARADKEWASNVAALSDSLGIDSREFGTPAVPGRAWAVAVDKAKENPQDELLKKALIDSELTYGFGLRPLTERNYEREIGRYLSTYTVDAAYDAELPEETPSAAIVFPDQGSAVIRYIPNASNAESYRTNAKRIGEQLAAKDKKRDLPTVEEIAAFELDNTILLRAKTPQARKGLVRTAVEAKQLAKGREDASAMPIVPVSTFFGKGVDIELLYEHVSVSSIIRLQQELGREPTEAEAADLTAERMSRLEQIIYSNNLPVFAGDASGTLAKIISTADEVQESPTLGIIPRLEQGQTVLGSKALGETARRTQTDLATADAKTLRLATQVFVPKEVYSGTITYGDQTFRAAEDRFAEWILGRNALSSSLDYILAMAPTEAVAPAYALALEELSEEYPDSPLDGLLISHPVDFASRWVHHIGSEEALLDSAARDDQYAVMMGTLGRGVNPLLAVAPTPDEDSSEFYTNLHTMNQGMSTIGGIGLGLIAAFKEPDAFAAAAKTFGQVRKGVDSVKALNAARGVRKAMEVSANAAGRGLDELLTGEMLVEDAEKLATSVLGVERAEIDQFRIDAGSDEVYARELTNMVRGGLERVFDDVATRDVSGRLVSEQLTKLDAAEIVDIILASNLNARGKQSLFEAVVQKTPEVEGGLTAVTVAAQTAEANARGLTRPDTAPLTRANTVRRQAEKVGEEVAERQAKLDDDVSALELDLEAATAYQQQAATVTELAERRAALVGLDTSLDAQIARLENRVVSDAQVAKRAAELLEGQPGQAAIDLIRTLWGNPKKRLSKAKEDMLRVFLAEAGEFRHGTTIRETLQNMQKEGVDLEELRGNFLAKTLDFIEGPGQSRLLRVEPGRPGKRPRPPNLVYAKADGGEEVVRLDTRRLREYGTESYFLQRQETYARRIEILDSRKKAVFSAILANGKKLDKAREGLTTTLRKSLDRTRKTDVTKTRAVESVNKSLTRFLDKVQKVEDRMRAGKTMGVRRRSLQRQAGEVGAKAAKRQQAKPIESKLTKKTQQAETARLHKEQSRALERAAVDTYFQTLKANFDLLKTMNRVETAARTTGDFSRVERVFDRYLQGEYNTDSFVEALAAESAGIQRMAAAIWGNPEVTGQWLTRLENSPSLEAYRQAQWFFMDPKGTAAQAQGSASFSLRLLNSAAYRFYAGKQLLTGLPAEARDMVNIHLSRALFQLRKDTKTLAQGRPSGNIVNEFVYQETLQAKRRQLVMSADLDALDARVNTLAKNRLLNSEDTARLIMRARTAYLSRDFAAMASSELSDIFRIVRGDDGEAVSAVTSSLSGQGVLGAVDRVFVGDSERSLRLLTSEIAPVDEVVDHLLDVARSWNDVMLARYNTEALDTMAPGSLLVALAKTYIPVDARPDATKKAVLHILEALRKPPSSVPSIANTTGVARYTELRKLLQEAAGNRPTGVDDFVGAERLLSGLVSNGSIAARSQKRIIQAGVGVTAADARSISLLLSRQAPDKEEGASLVAGLALFEAVGEGVEVGTAVYLFEDLTRFRHRAVRGKTKIPRRDPVTGQVKTTKLRKETKTRPPESGPRKAQMQTADRSKGSRPIEMVTGEADGVRRVDRPETSGAPQYKVIKVEGDEYTIAPASSAGAARVVSRADLRTAPPALRAGHTMDQLAKMGVVAPGNSIERAAMRLVMIGADDNQPMYVVNEAVAELEQLFQRYSKDLGKATASDTTNWFLDKVRYGGLVMADSMRFLAGAFLYDTPVLRDLAGSLRIGRTILEDTASTLMRSGPSNAAVVLVSGVNAYSRKVRAGEAYIPGMELATPLVPVLATSASAFARGVGLDKLLPNDMALLLNGPLKTLDSIDPDSVFRLPGGMTLRGADGQPMTAGQVKDELIAAGVYDTFHSRLRDALLWESVKEARGKQRSVLDSLPSRKLRRTVENVRARAELRNDRLYRVVSDISSEQRAALYLQQRLAGMAPDEAERVLNTNLLNWTEPSYVMTLLGKHAQFAAPVLLYARAREQAARQTARQYARFLGGDDDGLRAFVVYSRMKERVIPYLAQQYEGERTEENLQEYAGAVRQMELARRDWEAPYVYLRSEPYTRAEQIRFSNAVGGEQQFVGRTLTTAFRGDYDEYSLGLSLTSTAAAFTVGTAAAKILGTTAPEMNVSPRGMVSGLLEAAVGTLNPLVFLSDDEIFATYEKPGLKALYIISNQMNKNTRGLIGTTTPPGDAKQVGTEISAKQATKVGPSALGSIPGVDRFTGVAQRGLERRFQIVQTQLALMNLAYSGEATPLPASVDTLRMFAGDKAADEFAKNPRVFMRDEFQPNSDVYLNRMSKLLAAQTEAVFLNPGSPTFIRQRDIRGQDLANMQKDNRDFIEALRQDLLHLAGSSLESETLAEEEEE